MVMRFEDWRYRAATIPPRREREDGVSRSIR
jgi:hypothetical protein